MSLCAYIDTHCATPAPDDAALKRSVNVIDLVRHVAAGAPSHLHHAIRIGDAAADQLVDAGHHVEVRVLEVVADHVAQERVAVAGAAAIVRLQARRSLCRRAPGSRKTTTRC